VSGRALTAVRPRADIRFCSCREPAAPWRCDCRKWYGFGTGDSLHGCTPGVQHASRPIGETAVPPASYPAGGAGFPAGHPCPGRNSDCSAPWRTPTTRVCTWKERWG